MSHGAPRRTSTRLNNVPKPSYITLDSSSSDDSDGDNNGDNDGDGGDVDQAALGRRRSKRQSVNPRNNGNTDMASQPIARFGSGRKYDDDNNNNNNINNKNDHKNNNDDPIQAPKPTFRHRRHQDYEQELLAREHYADDLDSIDLLDDALTTTTAATTNRTFFLDSSRRNQATNQPNPAPKPKAKLITKKQRMAQFDYSDDAQFFFGVNELGPSVASSSNNTHVSLGQGTTSSNSFFPPLASSASSTAATNTTFSARKTKPQAKKPVASKMASWSSSRNHVSGNMFDEFDDDEEVASLSGVRKMARNTTQLASSSLSSSSASSFGLNNLSRQKDIIGPDDEAVSGDDSDSFIYSYHDDGTLVTAKKTKGQLRLERQRKKWTSFSSKTPADVMEDDINHPNGFIIAIKLVHCEIKSELVRERAGESVYTIPPCFDDTLVLSPLLPTSVFSSPLPGSDEDMVNRFHGELGSGTDGSGGNNGFSVGGLTKTLPTVHGMDLFPNDPACFGYETRTTSPHKDNERTNTTINNNNRTSSNLSQTLSFVATQSQTGSTTDKTYSDLNPFLCTSQELASFEFDQSQQQHHHPLRSQSQCLGSTQPLITQDGFTHYSMQTTTTTTDFGDLNNNHRINNNTTNTSSQNNNTSNNNDPDSDLEIVGVANNPFTDPMIFTPHNRSHCKRLVPLPPIMIESLRLAPELFSRRYPLWAYCDNCYCAVCDAPVVRCGNWKQHFKRQDDGALKKDFKAMLNYCHRNNLLPSLLATPPGVAKSSGGTTPSSSAVPPQPPPKPFSPETYPRTQADNTFIIAKIKDKPPGFLAKDGKSKSIFAMFAQHHNG